MQKHHQGEAEILNNHEETQDTNFNDAVELGSLTTATYYQSHGRERRGRSKKSVNNARLTDTDTEAEEDELLLSPGKRRQSKKTYENKNKNGSIRKQKRSLGCCSNYLTCCLPKTGKTNITSKFRKMLGCCNMFSMICCRKKEFQSRTVWVGQECLQKFPPNVIKNTKYNILTFLPLVLWNQFKYFLNAFFLTLALTQFYAPLQVGYLYTYWLPLAFVIGVGLIREATEDLIRYSRDKELNSRRYAKLTQRGPVSIASKDLKVGDIVYVEKGCRIPADMLLLRTTEHTGATFIKTDQLDGETDWKLRLALPFTQKLKTDEDLMGVEISIYAEKPQKDIHSFIGKYTFHGHAHQEETLDIENTMWANTVVANGTAIGIIIYSGPECRANMNNSTPKWKFGLIDKEVNNLTKVLFMATMVLSFVLVALKGFDGEWYIYLARFIILFSYLIPISLLVHLEIAKVYYSWRIQKDKEIPGSIVRSTTIPEELGRLSYLLSDKTGTLTQNEMLFKKLHLGTAAYSSETFDDIEKNLRSYYSSEHAVGSSVSGDSGIGNKGVKQKIRKTAVSRASEAVKALALCHNVTPTFEDESYQTVSEDLSNAEDATEADQGTSRAMAAAAAGVNVKVTYQASSPDEVALVIWAEQMGLILIERTLTSMKLKTPLGEIVGYTILHVFPFTSESKRMGIIVKDEKTNEIIFYMKGADVVMSSIVQYNDWLDEEVDNMAREGLRTLVVAKKSLSNEQYADFEQRYSNAKLAVVNRGAQVSAVVESLERDMELLCVTGVEDRLQDKVRITLEQLRNASVKVWMLTGDKLETATCIAKSSRLVSKTQAIHIFNTVTNRMEAHNEMNSFRRKQDTALVIKGDSLEVCLEYYEHEFMELVAACPAVVCCRCSPQQKAQVVKLIQQHTGKRTAAIGDGGNDVPMIQEANVGVGIVGKEGKQASLAADFSLTQFSHVAKLLLVHGRNSYKRSASIAQFIIHRGLIITTMQAIFSAMFYFASVQLFQGILLVGYATFYTMFPIVALALDQDVPAETALTYPELYKDLLKGRSLTYKTFFIWCLIGLYQGGILMFGAVVLFDDEFIHVISISFTALILTELIMIALTVRTWHLAMIAAEILSLAIYLVSVIIFPESFDLPFMLDWSFVWKVVAITAVSCVPLYILKLIRKKVAPSSYQKLT